ncbi:hypothetical protein NC652_037927 [Populus alba x Populus x berolinensis]|nr:hypothetical protein NC652_037927 [Populus alba x Populus x berolinensis]
MESFTIVGTIVAFLNLMLKCELRDSHGKESKGEDVGLGAGLLIQMPGHQRYIEFGNFKTSGVSILVHSILYFALICIFLLAVGVHIKLLLLSYRIIMMLNTILHTSNLFFSIQRDGRDGYRHKNKIKKPQRFCTPWQNPDFIWCTT